MEDYLVAPAVLSSEANQTTKFSKTLAEIINKEIKSIANAGAFATLALGTGSTVAAFWEQFVKIFPKDIQLKVLCTSDQSRRLVLAVKAPNITICDCEQFHFQSDILIDGFDLIDNECNMIKGGGAALLMEKVLALNSRRRIYIGASTKKTGSFQSSTFKLPIEVSPRVSGFATGEIMNRLGYCAILRDSSSGRYGPVITDNHNYVLDVMVTGEGDLNHTDQMLSLIPGVVATGFFPRFIAHCVYLNDGNGNVVELSA